MKIGVITSAHGVRGQVKIHTFIRDPEELFTYALTDASGKRPFKLKRQGVKDTLLIVSIDGITDRNEAELLKGTELYVPADTIQQEDSLAGFEARLTDGNLYGRISGVYNFGAGDILEIELASGQSEMIPLNENFVGDVQMDEGYLIVFPPEYVEGG